ncbi:DUF4330 domain-containing protein [bacterium]|nr:DUF4330 domain-containing protein [bacterium]
MKFIEILKKLRPLDMAIIAIVIIGLFIGALTVFGKRQTADKQIEANVRVEISVFFRGVTLTSSNSPFVVGEETFITIRNVPYTKLKIVSVSNDRKKTVVPTMSPKQQFVVVDDVSAPFQFDFVVTVVDDAKITKDGAVIGGNKIKIGLPVTFEGKDYRFNGVVSNITINKEPTREENSELTTQVSENQDVQ